MSEIVLKVENLVKNYGSFRAVDGISFTVPKGKIVGFLGPNGAGKTTTIQMLLGITLVNGGSIEYFGKSFFTNREYCLQKINYASAFNELIGRMTVMENLVVFGNLYQIQNPQNIITELAEYFEITFLLNEQYNNLSAGQKTRVGLVKALINNPELLLMDEPTASLDPDIADKVLTLIENLRSQRNLSILYTSHNMAEITRLCDEVIFLDKGKIVAQDTPVNLTKRITGSVMRLTFNTDKNEFETYLRKHKQAFDFTDDHTVVIKIEERLVPKILFGISKTKIYITDIEVQKPTLEDVFLQIARKE